MGLMAAALVLNIVPLDGTLSFLTSEKKQVSPVSTGTNEDVFVTETEQIVLKTRVEKKTKIKRTVNADGSSSETKDNRLSVFNGVQRITFVPQREHFDLDLANITVTGEAADEVTVQRVIDDKDGREIVFEVSHSYQEARGKRKSETEKGELRVTALGGFYLLSIPITISTSYRESTDVSEEVAPSQPGTPGTPDSPSTPGAPATPDSPNTPAPGGNEPEPAQPPSAGTDTPNTPSTDPSGPAPPSPQDTGTDSPVTNTQEGTPSGSPSTPDEPPASE